MAYADPPYIGQSAKHYGDHPDYAGEVDHAELVERLERDYPDGWALSLSSPTLKEILNLCPDDVRVMAWVKPFAAFKRNVRVAYAWEPVIVKPAERLDGAIPTRDFVAEPITMKRGLSGAKPDGFCHWLFAAMGLRPGAGDHLHDLFPGSGAVARAWESWNARLPLLEEVALNPCRLSTTSRESSICLPARAAPAWATTRPGSTSPAWTSPRSPATRSRLCRPTPWTFSAPFAGATKPFDAIHASPPCQGYSNAQRLRGNQHGRMIAAVRGLLEDIGVPYVIENVVGARGELRNPVLLCGAMFPELRTYRHRLFETNWPLTAPLHPEHVAPQVKMGRKAKPGEWLQVVGNFSGVDEGREAMGMPWATREGLREAIPPAYTRWIGERLLDHWWAEDRAEAA